MNNGLPCLAKRFSNSLTLLFSCLDFLSSLKDQCIVCNVWIACSTNQELTIQQYTEAQVKTQIRSLSLIYSVSQFAKRVYIKMHKNRILEATNMKHSVNDSWFPIISVHCSISKLRSGPKWPLFSNPLTFVYLLCEPFKVNTRLGNKISKGQNHIEPC